MSHLIRGCLLRTFCSTGHHAGFEDGALQVNLVVSQSLVDGGEDKLRDLHGSVQVMVSISTDVWLNNWNQSRNRRCNFRLECNLCTI